MNVVVAVRSQVVAHHQYHLIERANDHMTVT